MNLVRACLWRVERISRWREGRVVELYGTSIAVTIRSLDPSLSAQLILITRLICSAVRSRTYRLSGAGRNGGRGICYRAPYPVT